MCHTKGLSALLPSFLQGSTLMGLLAAPSALVELLVDPDRHILYTRAASSAMQVRGTLPALFIQPSNPGHVSIYGRWL